MNLVMICLSAATAQAVGNKAELRLDKTEVQQFERSYEAWVQSLIHHLLPKEEVSVLTEFNYSTSSELIQNYEEKRAANHLPGLPDVADMNDSHPTENPIYELVTQQNIKVIFDHQPADDQIRVLKEILVTKLDLDTTHGDQISFDQLHHGHDYLGKIATAVRKNVRFAATFLLLALVAVFFITRKNKISSQLRVMGEKEINALYIKLNPIASILKTDAKLLISVVQKQEFGFLAQVMTHAPIQFNQIILQVFEERDRKELFEAYRMQRLTVSRKKSRYSQLLLAAKLHDELKIAAIQEIDVLDDVSANIREYRVKMQKSLNELKALYESSAKTQIKTEEVNHELSI